MLVKNILIVLLFFCFLTACDYSLGPQPADAGNNSPVDNTIDPPAQGSSLLATDDSMATDEDTPLTADVTLNDTANSSLDKNSIDIVSAPLNGTANVDVAGDVTYTPDANYNGADSFSYTVQDLDGTVSIADFAILQNHYNQPGSFTDGDFNFDGTVSIADFAILQNNYNTVYFTEPLPAPLPKLVELPS